MASKETVCVTGASGFIGSWIVRLLLERGYSVQGTVQDLGNEKETKHLVAMEGAKERLKLFQIDLLDYGSIEAAINGSVGVFHLASPCIVEEVKDPQSQLLDPAVKGTMHVLQAAQKAKVRRLVLTSSISAIIPSPNWPSDVPKDENCWTDLDYCKQNGIWYPASKTLAEKAAWDFAKEVGLDVVVINPGTVMGPILPPAINASMGMLLHLLQDLFYVCHWMKTSWCLCNFVSNGPFNFFPSPHSRYKTHGKLLVHSFHYQIWIGAKLKIKIQM